jgi:DNA polymerase delta subunit 3
MKVHSKIAKQMLFAFHQTENAKKVDSCHATYIISGIRHDPSPPTNGFHDHDEDTTMQSSPPLSSLPEPQPAYEPEIIPTQTVMVVRQEHLEEAKALLEEVISVFVYSLEPSSLANLQVLSDCTREMYEKHAKEDPLEAWKQYGTIQNPNVKRRTGRRPLGVPAPTAAPSRTTAKPTATVSKDNGPKSSAQPAKSGTAADTTGRDSAGAHAKPASNLGPSKPGTAPSKRDSGLFASFAKAKPKEKTKANSAHPEAADGKSSLPQSPATMLIPKQSPCWTPRIMKRSLSPW